jgi:hypothetical protein
MEVKVIGEKRLSERGGRSIWILLVERERHDERASTRRKIRGRDFAAMRVRNFPA